MLTDFNIAVKNKGGPFCHQAAPKLGNNYCFIGSLSVCVT